MTKKELYRYASKMYKILDNPNFRVTFWRTNDFMGECYQGQNLIRLEPSKDLLSTVVHELIHEMYHEMPEEKVVAKENELMKQLSHRQLINLLEKTSNALRRTSRKLKLPQ